MTLDHFFLSFLQMGAVQFNFSSKVNPKYFIDDTFCMVTPLMFIFKMSIIMFPLKNHVFVFISTVA